MSSPTTEPGLSEVRPAGVVLADLREVTLPVQGMTCASCAARVEKRLNRMPGVTATVNYATEQAHVSYPPDLDPADLVATVERAGYHAQLPAPPARSGTPMPAAPGEHQHEHEDATALAPRLLISAALTLPVLLLAMIPAWQFRNWQWISLTLASPVVVWGAWPFHRATWLNARHGATTMDTLVSLGVTAAYGWSLYALLFTPAGDSGMTTGMATATTTATTTPATTGAAHLYLETAAVVTTFLLAGRYAEARAKRRSGDALRALLDLGAKDVVVLRRDAAGTEREVLIPVADLAVGERFVVRPGEKIATDGVVVGGASAIDASLLTGESVPVDVAAGDEVTGATLNTSGRLVVEARRVGAETTLAQIGRLVTAAQTGKAPVQRLADRISAVFVPAVLVVAALTLAGWLLAGAGSTRAFTAAVAVLVIACPCALGLATPTALLVGTGRGAQLGILIRGPQVLEQTRRADVVLLDKTGTLTEGRMRLARVVPTAPGAEATTAIRLAAAVEAAAEHPIGQAIAAAGRADGDLAPVTGFAASAGLGVVGDVDGRRVLVGRPEWLREKGIDVTADTEDAVEAERVAGRTAVVAAWPDGQAVLAVEDSVRPTAAQAISQLRELGLRPTMLTGDAAATARAVARTVGIDEADVVAGVRPAGKVAAVTGLQDRGHVVAMAGDGVNDAAALAAADLGLAMGSGSDVAIEAGDITLVRTDPLALVDAVRLSRRTLATIRGNLFWAFGYNVAAIPLAASGRLSPMIAGAAMAFSSVFVVTNSLRLRGFQPVTAR